MASRGLPEHEGLEYEAIFDRLFRDDRTNAVLAWAMVAVLALVGLESVLGLDVQWIGMVAGLGILVLVPPIAHREWRVMLPWELLFLALLPVLVRGLLGGEVGTFATYTAVAAIALIVTVELQTFTALRVTHWFAVTFVVLATLASAAAWTILRWTLDTRLGTAYLTTNDALMREFLWVGLAGVAAGLLFDLYFRRRDSHLQRAYRRVMP